MTPTTASVPHHRARRARVLQDRHLDGPATSPRHPLRPRVRAAGLPRRTSQPASGRAPRSVGGDSGGTAPRGPSSTPPARSSARPSWTSAPWAGDAPYDGRHARRACHPGRARMDEVGVDVLLLSRRPGPALPDRLRGDAAGAADHAGAAPRRRRHPRGPSAGGATGDRAPRRVRPAALGRDRGPGRHRRRPGGGGRAGGRRRPHLGPFVLDLQAALPGAAFSKAGLVTGPLRAVKDGAEVEALRAAARRSTASPPTSRPATSTWWAGPRRRCRPTSAGASWPKATST